jgi:hypothetical protein
MLAGLDWIFISTTSQSLQAGFHLLADQARQKTQDGGVVIHAVLIDGHRRELPASTIAKTALQKFGTLFSFVVNKIMVYRTVCSLGSGFGSAETASSAAFSVFLAEERGSSSVNSTMMSSRSGMMPRAR